MVWIAIAWRNLWRQGRRSLITASAMAVSVGLCMSVICLNDGTYLKLFEVMVEQSLGHVQVHHPDYPGKQGLFDTVPGAKDALAAIDASTGVVAATARMNGFGLVGGPDRSAGAQLIGVDASRERKLTKVWDRMKTGTYLSEGGSGEAILGWKLAEDLAVGVGDEVVVVTQASDGSLGNVLFTVAGTYRSGDSGMDRAGAYVHLADMQDLLVLEDQAHEITILADDADALVPLKERLEAKLGDDTLVRTWQEVSPQTSQLLGMQDAASGIILGIVFAVASFGVINTMLVSVFERTRELGVMRALGVGPGQLVALVVIESLLLGVMAGVGGLLLGGALDYYLITVGLDLSASMPDGFDFNGVTLDPVMYGAFRIEPIVMTFVTLITVSGIAAVWPALRAAWIRPVEAIRTE